MAEHSKKRRVCVVTGSRAEFGLLVPVMDAIRRVKGLELCVVAAGAHMLRPARTIKEVRARYTVAATVPMQRDGETGRAADARALGRGVEGFARAFARLKPAWVVVLGDRIEAFAAASAASVAGIAVCHIHGGDRAEGIADEAMRHAITKLAHLHCAATKQSAKRIIAMGEKREHVHVTGSPAIDGLKAIKAMSDREARKLGDPRVVVLLHPAGLEARQEIQQATVAIAAAHVAGRERGDQSRSSILVLDPNSDPGREHIMSLWDAIQGWTQVTRTTHLSRTVFLMLLKRLSQRRGLIVGNSSAGLIEAAALGVVAANVGPRQTGRERGGNVVDFPYEWRSVAKRLQEVRELASRGRSTRHPYGDGRAGERIAGLLSSTNPIGLIRKRNTY